MTRNNTPRGAAGLGIWGNLGIWLAFGLAFGVVVGAFLDNAGVGVAFGPLLGLVVYLVFIAPRNARSKS